MKKLFLAALMTFALVIPNIAAAGYCDEYKAKYPTRVKTKTEQNLSGKMVTTSEYHIFWHNNFVLRVNRSTDYKYAYIQYYYLGKPIMLYNGFTYGDGNQIHDMELFIDPVRSVKNGYVSEMIMAAVNPAELKKAVIIHAHSQQSGPKVMISSSDPKWQEWQAALDDAEKLLADE